MKKLSLILMSLLFSTLVIELGLRILGPKYYRFGNRDKFYYSNPRGYHQAFRKGDVTLYGIEYRYSKEKYRLPPQNSDNHTASNEYSNSIQLLGLGDSFTFGQGVKYKDLYLTRLEALLDADGHNTTIKNCGALGADVSAIIDIYNNETANKRYPLVIYGFVLNDFGLHFEKDNTSFGSDFIDMNNGGYKYNPLREYSAVMNFIMHVIDKRRLHNETSRAYLNAFDDDRGFNQLLTLKKLVNENDARLILAIFPLFYNFDNYIFGDIHARLSGFCKKNNIICLDLFKSLSSHPAESLWVHPTDFHPNEIAHDIVAKEIYSLIKKKRLLQ